MRLVKLGELVAVMTRTGLAAVVAALVLAACGGGGGDTPVEYYFVGEYSPAPPGVFICISLCEVRRFPGRYATEAECKASAEYRTPPSAPRNRVGCTFIRTTE